MIVDPLAPILDKIQRDTPPPFEWVVAYAFDADASAAVARAWGASAAPATMIRTLQLAADAKGALRAAAATAQVAFADRETPADLARYRQAVAKLAAGATRVYLPSERVINTWANEPREDPDTRYRWRVMEHLRDAYALWRTPPVGRTVWDAAANTLKQIRHLYGDGAIDARLAAAIRAHVSAPRAAAIGFTL